MPVIWSNSPHHRHRAAGHRFGFGSPAVLDACRGYASDLEIFWHQSGSLGNPREHPGSYLTAVVESKNEIGPTISGQNSM